MLLYIEDKLINMDNVISVKVKCRNVSNNYSIVFSMISGEDECCFCFNKKHMAVEILKYIVRTIQYSISISTSVTYITNDKVHEHLVDVYGEC